jgi:hypothetical protein
MLESVAAEKELRWRIIGTHQHQSSSCQLVGITELLATHGLACLTDRIKKAVVIRNGPLCPDHGAPCPIRAKRAGAKGGDMEWRAGLIAELV